MSFFINLFLKNSEINAHGLGKKCKSGYNFWSINHKNIARWGFFFKSREVLVPVTFKRSFTFAVLKAYEEIVTSCFDGMTYMQDNFLRAL